MRLIIFHTGWRDKAKRELEIIGLAFVAATAFGVWSASTVAQSRVGKGDVLRRGSDSPHAIMVKLGSSLPSDTGRILTERIAASEPLASVERCFNCCGRIRWTSQLCLSGLRKRA